MEPFYTYMKFQRNMSDNTLNSYLTDIHQFEAFLNKPLEEAETEDIEGFIRHEREKGLSVSTVNRKLSAIKSYYKYLVRSGVLRHNPADVLESAKMEKRLPKPLDVEDVEAVISNAFSMRDKLLLTLLYGTGIRRSELVNIRVSDINFRREHITVFGKGNKERIIPLNQEVMQLMKEFITVTKSTWLFPGYGGGHISTRQVNDIVKKYGDKLGIENLTPHRFRHTLFSLMWERGADIRAIQEMAGHSSINTTNGYTKTSISRLQSEYEKCFPKAQ